MKAKRRHELQTNQLADWLGQKIEAIKPHAQWIIGGVILAAALIIVAVYFLSSGGGGRTASSDLVLANLEAQDRQKQLELASGGNDVWALWAVQFAADDELAQGTALLYDNRTRAMKMLDEAKTRYQRVVKGSKKDKLLNQRALLGLARTFEAQGKLTQARDTYRELASKAKGTVAGRVATAGIERIERAGINEYYRELAVYEPPKPRTPIPGESYLPDDLRHDISYPGIDVALNTNGFDPDGDDSPRPPEPDDEDIDDAPRPPEPDDEDVDDAQRPPEPDDKKTTPDDSSNSPLTPDPDGSS